ncbi:MAG: AAA family ATPase, partial [Promethearchaeota archaeon]
MTYIKKIVMHGFKSFGDRTISVKLAPGFTCIVGPNGAGKSNIIDALCFCLGRMSKKTMRAKNLADLIFAGTKKLKPANMASVSIFLDNSQKEFPVESEEVEITRIVKRKGGSTFKINGKNVTREQVLNMLAYGNIDPDGSNQFILQGKIVELTNMNIIERRQYIESLIGLEKYDQMKEQTLKELEKADRDLSKFEAIFKEVSTQLKKYEKEKNDALRWKELDNNIKKYNAELISLKIDKLNNEEMEIEKKIDEINILIKDLELKSSRQKEKIEQENLIMNNLDKELNQKNQEKDNIEQELSNLKSELSAKEMELKIAKETLKKLENKKAQLEQYQEPLNEGETYDLLIEDSEAVIEKYLQDIEEKENEEEETENLIREKYNEISEIEAQKTEINSEISKLRQNISSLESEIKMLNKNIKKAKKNLNKKESELASLKKEGQDVEDAIIETQKEIDNINNRINDLKEQIEKEQSSQKELETAIAQLEKEKSNK